MLPVRHWINWTANHKWVSEISCNTSPTTIKLSPFAVTKKYWICLSTTSYKSLPVNSLAFSSDGSLLAVGFANTLCIYIPKTLRIKAVLSTPSGQDGSTNKLIVNKSKVLSDITGKEYEQIKQMVKAFLENDDDKLLNELKDKVNKSPEMGQKKRTIELAFSDLAVEDKENIFAEIQKLNELNFFQKLEIFQKIGIHIRLPADLKEKFHEYVHNYMRVRDKENNLEERLSGLAPDKQFVAHLKLQNYLSRRSDAAANGLHMKNVTFYDDDDVAIVSSRRKNRDKAMEVDEKQKPVANPIRKVAKIKHILFAAGDCSHLVIVCTENRLLIWNLLTLRLHASFKLTVRHIAVDPRTNLVAAFTFFDECKSLDGCPLWINFHLPLFVPSVRFRTEQTVPAGHSKKYAKNCWSRVVSQTGTATAIVRH